MTDRVRVYQVPGLGYIVESESVTGAWRLVQGRDCSCPAGEAGFPSCRHRRAVAVFVADQERKYPPRPAGRVVPSMFVD